MEQKTVNFYKMASDVPPSREMKLEAQIEPLNFAKIPSDLPPAQREDSEAPAFTVADELNARLAMIQLRPDRAKRIKRLVKTKIANPQHMYKYFCVCPRYHPCYAPCQHTGQIIIDRDMLKRKEHICFLSTPKKNFINPQRLKQPRYITKKVYVPTCTARMKRLADPHPLRVQNTFDSFKHLLSKRHIAALQEQMKPKPPVDSMNIETAMEYIEEEMRQRRVRRQQQKKRCNHLKRLILKRQRKQLMTIVCVLFEEMKEFLLNDQFVIDEQSPLCAVILERIKEFTEQEFYTTSNLREYQKILANNITVWINKFISNLNIYVAPQKMTEQRAMHADKGEKFVPMSDYISLSGENEEEMEDDFDNMDDFESLLEEGLFVPEMASDETIIN